MQKADRKEVLSVIVDIRGIDATRLKSKKERAQAQAVIAMVRKEIVAPLAEVMPLNRDQHDTAFFVIRRQQDWPKDAITKRVLGMHERFAKLRSRLPSPFDKLTLRIFVHSDWAKRIDCYKFHEWTGPALWLPEQLLDRTPEKDAVVLTDAARTELDLSSLKTETREVETDSGKITIQTFLPPKKEIPSTGKISLGGWSYRLGLRKPVYRNLAINQPKVR